MSVRVDVADTAVAGVVAMRVVDVVSIVVVGSPVAFYNIRLVISPVVEYVKQRLVPVLALVRPPVLAPMTHNNQKRPTYQVPRRTTRRRSRRPLHLAPHRWWSRAPVAASSLRRCKSCGRLVVGT